MDNFTHGFFGACLSKAGLDRFTSHATLTLVIASNLPDVDSVASFMGQDTMFGFRRGWTHGVAAQILLPWILTLVITKLHHRLPFRAADAPPPRFAPVLALSYLGVLGHCFMDWLNTYGIRLLMPIDDLWRYGDTLFIIDPWVWLVSAAPLFMAYSASRLSWLLWAIFAGGATMLILAVPEVPPLAKGIWVVLLALILRHRAQRGVHISVQPHAAVATLIILLYVGGMKLGSMTAVQRAAGWAREKNIGFVEIAPMPLPASSLRREVVLATATAYHRVAIDLTGSRPPEEVHPPTARGDRTPVVEAALRTVPGTAQWMRFPYYLVETVPTGYRVTLRDFRYSQRGSRELGKTVVLLDASLEPL